MATRTPDTPGEVIWNYFDEAKYYPPASTVAPNAVFTYVGRLVSIKGVHVAIKGFAAARRKGLTHTLRIVGEGPERERLQALARLEGVSDVIEFMSFRDSSSLAALYRESYATLFPSQWEEPFGFVMVEAMACGSPVISSAHGACPEVIGSAGILVRHDDVDGWAKAILQLGMNPNTRQQLSELARIESRRFTLRNIADRYEQIIREVVTSYNSGYRCNNQGVMNIATRKGS